MHHLTQAKNELPRKGMTASRPVTDRELMMNKIAGRWGKQITHPAEHCQAVDNSSKGAN